MEQKTEVKSAGNTLSYEKLKQLANSLSIENNQLNRKLEQCSLFINSINRLDYLLKIIEQRDAYDDVFIQDCIKEIKEIMTLPEDDKEEK